MKKVEKQTGKHTWHFIQHGGLLQLKITSIQDVLHLQELDPKLWVALSCPVKGLEFSEETLSLLDTDQNGRVRIPEILAAVEYIRTYFKDPKIIMTKGDSIPLAALSSTAFPCGHSPAESARSVLHILEKDTASEITLDDVTVNDKLFSPAVLNGDGVLPPELFPDEQTQGIVKDIIACTGGSEDISGSRGVTQDQVAAFFGDLSALRAWRDSAQTDIPGVFFLKDATDAAATAYIKVRDKISEYFLRCSLNAYDSDFSLALRKKEEEALADNDMLMELPIAVSGAAKPLSLTEGINPAWKAAVTTFAHVVVQPILGDGKTALTESEWKRIEAAFEPYMTWYAARPANSAASLSFERIDEILASDVKDRLAAKFAEEEASPPLALATKELRKMLLLRRDFVTLLKNFVSFEDFYAPNRQAVFQCGTLYIDGRSCDLCFRVLDGTKHAAMSPLSQCYLLYCDCSRPSEKRTMQIAALVSAGNRDNLIVGRNGLFYDREGKDWDCTVTKIVENPISIREAFWMPYKKLTRLIQERIAKRAAESENAVNARLSSAVEKPGEAATETASAGAKKIDIGTVAALGVAVSGFAAVLGTVLGIITRRWWMPPVFLVGLVLIISLPSMILAWLKLRQRNIAPVLDASGWAVNGNVRINMALGACLTDIRRRPRLSKLNTFDPYKDKGFPWKRLLLCLLLAALLAGALAVTAKSGWSLPDAWAGVMAFCTGLVQHKA